MFINFNLIFDIVASPPKIEVADLITAVPSVSFGKMKHILCF